MLSAAERVIRIVHAPFEAAFAVEVAPPLVNEDLNATFPDHHRASRWADGLHRTRGWRVIDRTGLADLHRQQA
ncbi:MULTISPECIES: hypothetical protein [unclassified Sphingobium]|uniref:hypothetical protein n=1 Tax=unclassified Sphingobium TaxID=2611147 RepID=UPI000D17CEF4|nr:MULTISPECIES: hypothetical protein [unclassified Sphingobium]PSO12619.1 hypothetical protein C7E20_05795 [Sphingobium sp. AEW4]TWD09800.1 hypothetical protein FB595_104147 [Sphingobium sp. AEW010]TWD26471.1 hypothetical protein FB596_104147 [Sphingobium sp. AEW013]TWD27760.1 hypothetical protein FB594_105181 [Sphingobium sp. AEW001]